MSDSGEPALKCRSLVVSADRDGSPDFPFLRGAELVVPQGSVTSVDGLTVSEQTALRRVIEGLAAPTYGSVEVRDGRAAIRVVTDASRDDSTTLPGQTVLVLTYDSVEPWQPARRLRAYGGLLLDVPCTA